MMPQASWELFFCFYFVYIDLLTTSNTRISLKHFKSNGELAGLITDIQKYTIHDGPGIRTEIFFKGCPLHCPWCSNPETMNPEKQLSVRTTKCMGQDLCGWCTDVCPLGADTPIRFAEDGSLLPIQMVSECKGCFKCVEACPGGAIFSWGDLYTVDELMKIILEDIEFYDKNGGGVTLSGGDVTMQWEFASRLLAACKEKGIHTCTETEALCPPEHLDALMGNSDLLIFDIKCFDASEHIKLFGTGNDLILSNIARAAEAGKQMIVRTPVVMGYNGSDDDIRSIAAFLQMIVGENLVAYQLLPYRKMGVEKYDSMGKPYPLMSYEVPDVATSEANLRRLGDMVVSEFGIPVKIGQ